MSALPTWLTTLERVREQRRNAAWQSLAQSLRDAAEARAATTEIAEGLARLRESQQQSALSGRVDAERLRQLREDRTDRLSQLAEAHRRQSESEARLQKAQSEATVHEADVEILQKLSNRLLAARRIEQQRRQEQSTLEVSLSLCNERLGD